MYKNNIIKSYQVKKIGKKRILNFSQEVDHISSPENSKGTLKAEVEKFKDTLERLESEIEDRRKELVLLKQEYEKIKVEKEKLIAQIEGEGKKRALAQEKRLLEEYRQKGYQDGYQRGAEEALIQVKEKYQEFFNYLNSLEQQIEEYYQNFSEKYLKEELALIFALIKKVLKSPTLKEEFEKMVKENYLILKEKLGDIRKHDVFINEEDYDNFKKFIEELYQNKEELKPNIYPSNKVPKGGCLIETAFGTLEINMGNEIEDIYKEFLNNLSFSK